MRRRKHLVGTAVFLTVVVAHHHASATATVHLQVESAVTAASVPRLGVNLGTANSWGAEQFFSNIVRNPGFEGTVDRALVTVSSAGGRGFADDTAWLGREDGFWNGARFDVRTGRSAGRSGTIVDSKRVGNDRRSAFSLDASVDFLDPGDVVALTRIQEGEFPPSWWVAEHSRPHVTTTTTERRPGSPGRQSVTLQANDPAATEINSFMDRIGDRAGKLLPVNGHWRLSFWVRTDRPGATLDVRFRRLQGSPFVDEQLQPTREWKHTVIEFEARDDGPPQPLELRFAARGNGEHVFLDDVDLRRVTDSGFPFREEVVQALGRLRPGYLRDWQGQLGDTLENRLAPPLARRPSRWSPGDAGALHYSYSLPEFLDLCRRVGARPWIVLPTTFGDAEFIGLGKFLAERAAADGFEEIVVEFGNENWNPLFRAAGIPSPQAHGQAAERAFEKLRQGAGGNTLFTAVVNAQYVDENGALSFLGSAPSANVLAVAPYFMYSLQAKTEPPQALAAMFAQDNDRLQALSEAARGRGKELAVYEVNLHTAGGDAPAERRDPITAGAAAGAALAKRLLAALRAGATRQCAYALAGYDAFLSPGDGFVKLWGLVRDLGPTQRLRPTGLAVSMLNEVVRGDAHRVRQLGASGKPTVDALAFRSETGWALAVVSSSAEPAEVEVRFPKDARTALPTHVQRLKAPDVLATNEEAANVRAVTDRVEQQNRTVRFFLPAYGLVTLLP